MKDAIRTCITGYLIMFKTVNIVFYNSLAGNIYEAAITYYYPPYFIINRIVSIECNCTALEANQTAA